MDVAHASGGRFDPDPQKIYAEWADLRAWADGASLPEGRPYDRGDLDSPVPAPSQPITFGLNYRDHAAETGLAVPEGLPPVFTKFASSLTGPYTTVRLPEGNVDWEVELAVVIGRTARYVADDEDPLAYVAGYAVAHDVSEREFQIERGGTWDKGKNCETFNPLGPWLVTADEVGDPQELSLKLWVNGELKQDGTTAEQIFPVAEVVRYVSQFMVLYPGDVINTGTPAGVALGAPEPKPFLRGGDVVELEIGGLGRQRQEFKNA